MAMAGEGDEDDDSPFPYELVVDDPAGNSYVESFSAPGTDPALSTAHSYRQRVVLWYFSLVRLLCPAHPVHVLKRPRRRQLRFPRTHARGEPE